MASPVRPRATNGPGLLTSEQQAYGLGDRTRRIATANIKDLQLCQKAQYNQVDFERLYARLTPLVEHIIQRYYARSMDPDDLRQEGRYGLYKAIRDYDGTSSLANFAWLCVDRQVATAVKTALRNKHRPLNQADSFSQPWFSANGSTRLELGEAIADPSPSFLQQIESRRELREFLLFIRYDLSELERKIFQLWAADEPYGRIAEHLDVSTKTVDNGLQRMKRKLTEARQRIAAGVSMHHTSTKPTHSVRRGSHMRERERERPKRESPQSRCWLPALRQPGEPSRIKRQVEQPAS